MDWTYSRRYVALCLSIDVRSISLSDPMFVCCVYVKCARWSFFAIKVSIKAILIVIIKFIIIYHCHLFLFCVLACCFF